MRTRWRNRAKVLVCLAFAGLATGVKGQEKETTEPPPPPAAVQEKAKSESVPFYSTLNPHGTWVQVSPFGMVWQPTIVKTTREWRPYSNGGRWTWKDNAWYWQSDYDWGWVTFHYGRWMHGTDTGWVWVPGTEWAPAWVSWKRTDSTYCWAPMPVEKKLYVDTRWNIGRNIEWGFTFTLRDESYCSAPACDFGAVETPQVVVVRPVEPAVTVIYRTEPSCYPVTRWYSTRSYHHDSYRSDRSHHSYTRTPERREPERREPERHTSTQSPRTRTSTPARQPSRTTTDRRTTGISNIMSRSRK